MTKEVKSAIEQLVIWLGNNIDIDAGIPLIFRLGSEEQNYLESLLKNE